MSSIARKHDRPDETGRRPNLRLVKGPKPWPASSADGQADDSISMSFTFRELTLIHKSLQAVRTLGALAPQDELLNDTIHLVDLALTEALQRNRTATGSRAAASN
jgi:hypothetical protein